MNISRRQFVFSMAALSATSTCKGVWADEPQPRRPIQILSGTAIGRKEEQPVITGVTIDPTGQLLATVGDDHIVRIWDLVDGSLLHELRGHTDWIRTAVFSPTGETLLTAGNDRKILMWSADDFTHARQFAEHPQAISALDFDPMGHRVAVAGFDQELRIYHMESMQGEAAGEGHEHANCPCNDIRECPCNDMRALKFSPDGQLLVGGGRSGLLRIWNFQNDQNHTIEAHRRRIRAVQFTPDGETIVSSGEDRMIRLWNAEGEMTNEWLCRGAKVLCMAMIDETRLALGGTDNSIRIWDIEQGVEVERLLGHGGSIAAVDSRDGILVSGSYDTTTRVWDMNAEGDHQANIPLDTEPVR